VRLSYDRSLYRGSSPASCGKILAQRCDGFLAGDVITVMSDAEQGTCSPAVAVMSAHTMPDDAQRFTDLYLEHHTRVRDFAQRRVGRELAQEVVAETFLVAWRRIEDVPDAVLPWLYRVALYEIANLRRRHATSARLHDALRDRRPGPGPGAGEEGVADLARAVARAFTSLPEHDQEILRLAAWEQVSAVEGAAVLGCSVAAYRMRLHRARARLAAGSDVRDYLRPHLSQARGAGPEPARAHASDRRPVAGPELAL
jgi:RNA polymerase sigma-70 factor (ECF subfamily)